MMIRLALQRCLVLVVIVSAAVAARGAQDEAPDAEKQAAEIARLVKDLDSNTFDVRRKATNRLIEIGKPAVAAIEKATETGSLEVTNRGLSILKALRQSRSPETKQATDEALDRLSRSKNKQVSQRARRLLQPDKAPAIAAPNPGIRLPNLQGIGRVQIQTRTVNGARTVNVSENGKKIQINDTNGKDIRIRVTETVAGKEKTTEYKAKDADDLKKKHPDAHKLYEKYTGKNFQGLFPRGLGGFRIAAPPFPKGLLPRQRRVLPRVFRPFIEEPLKDIRDARSELDGALESLKKAATDGAKPDELKRIAKQIEDANQKLADAQKKLGDE